ncbi:MAG: aldose 1-epimerase [Alphaproteobacteria bacterium]
MPEKLPRRVTLRDGECALTIAPAIGGSITRYWSQGPGGGTIEWMRPASDRDLAAGELRGMSSFPLVPFSNRIRDGRFSFQGRDIALPLNFLPERHTIHGQGWKRAWTVTEQTANRLAIAYDHAGDDWPFPYHAAQDFQLTGDILEQTLMVRNTGDQDMPLGLGVHPYFVRTPRATITATVDAMWTTDEETMPKDLVTPPPERQPANGIIADEIRIDNTYVGWRGEARVTWPEWHAHLTIRADPPLDKLVLFTPTGEDYLCVEPVTNITDAFNYATQGRDDTGLIVLAPGGSQSYTITFTPSRDP